MLRKRKKRKRTPPRRPARKIETITVEVVRHSLIAAAWEMFRVFKRTATLALLYEMTDFAMAIYDRDLNILAEAPGVPMFSGSLDFALKATIEELGRDPMEPFDVVVNNHPYLVGGQPADAAVFEPIFHRGQVIGYVGMRAHMGDCGAINQYPTSSTDMYQEGTILPSLKLYRRGVLDEGVLRSITSNSRLPLETGGDFIAGAAALNAGRKRVLEIVEKYGLEVVEAAKEQIFDHGEHLTREAIGKMPDGIYKTVDFLDNDGVDDEPVRLELAVKIKGTNIVVDFSGSAPQRRGPINCAYSYTVTCSRFGLRLITTPDLPTNAGMFRPLKVIAPVGCIYNPTPPAPGWIGGWAASRIIDLIPLALAKVLPKQVPAPPSGVHNLVLGYVKDAKDKLHFVLDIGPGGLGGTAEADGASAVNHVMQAGSVNIPVEVQESKTPLLVERYELSTRSGAGRFRGGFGVRSVMRFLGEGQMTTVMERTKFQLPGLHGGKKVPEPCKLVLWPGTRKETSGHKSDNTRIQAGDRVILDTTGGAGYGNPLERDPEKVLWDVLNEYISPKEARKDYGVVIDLDSRRVNQSATQELRLQRSSERT